jgi:hypothetical protein
MLEQNAKGYFTGNFICSFCGHKVAQAQWFDTLAATSSGREVAHGLSRSAPRQHPQQH